MLCQISYAPLRQRAANLQMIRGMRLAGMENVQLERIIYAWIHPASANYSLPKRMILTMLSIFGEKPFHLIYHSRRFFKDEITYFYRRPS